MMMDWLDSVAGPQYVPAILWTLAALAALIVVLLLVKLFRRASTGAFVAGGRNRKTRLSVMDATAVDSHRRLVLVRRDDVEHLLLIGGANDLVVEQNIRLVAPTRRPPPPTPAPQAGEPAAHVPPPRPAPPPAPQPAQRAPATAVAQRHPASEIKAAPRPMVQPRPAPPQERPAVAPKPVASPAPPPRPVPPAADDIDDALLQELEVTLDNERGRTTRSTEASLEDEMTRLLGELSNPKK